MTGDGEKGTATTYRGLTIDLVDYFHDWIDGDDWPTEVKQVADNSIDLLFESGTRLNVLVRELPESGSDPYPYGRCACGGALNQHGVCEDKCARESWDR